MLNSRTIFDTDANKVKEEKIKCLQNIDENITKTLQDIRTLYSIDEFEGSRKLISILDELLSNNDWESSLLLRAAKKHLNALKDEAKQIADSFKISEQHEDIDVSLQEGYIKVYISLYQTEGAKLKIWHDMLKSLSEYSTNRPVYRDEEQVRMAIRSKPDMQRHAYAVVTIPENGIIHFEKPAVDRLGHELLTLKDNVIETKNIIEFVHANEKRYKLRNDMLVLDIRG
ncbi:MAG: hypothetical protein AMJ43_04235 [Coxiella sp. DG_40]|nr:MAG: hypothetical protein AMJ43_04235 [Coxiella sp. DG_40]